MPALNTDLYQLTMAAGYFVAGKADEIGTFELQVRRIPGQRNFLLAAGLQQAVEYLLELRFESYELEYLRSLPQLQNAPPEFFQYLADFRFSGDLFAMPEGTPFFSGEPIAFVRAPLIEAQLVETFLLSTFAFQTSIASKAARCVIAAQGRPVIEFGTRRAHSPAAGMLGSRAAYIGGCTGTSNTEAGMQFVIPVSGTAAHSFTMAFPTEENAFRKLQEVLGPFTVFLIDTYDTLEGARRVARIGGPMTGVRLDSGDLEALSREVRTILDNAGLKAAKIMATNDLDEYRIEELVGKGVPIDSFGVGTQLATSADAPSLSAIYKLVELRQGEQVHYTAKYSDEKITIPGAKQVFRSEGSDTIALGSECPGDCSGQPLLRPVLVNGDLAEALPTASRARENSLRSLAALPAPLRSLRAAAPYKVILSQKLQELAASVKLEHDAQTHP